jgi:TRAP-type C4-dicarboxylate transport system permease small subunit
MTSRPCIDVTQSTGPAGSGGPLPADLCFLRRALAGVAVAEIGVCVLALACICVINAIGVVLRYGFNSSLIWSGEVSGLLASVMTFCGIGLIYKTRSYIVLEFVFRTLPSPLQRALAILTWCGVLIFGLVIAWNGVALYPIQSRSPTFILELPRFLYTVPVIYGGISLSLTSAYYLLSVLRLGTTMSIFEIERWNMILPSVEQH